MARATLKSRLLIGSLLVLPIVLMIAGAALDRAYRHSLEASEQVRLERYFYLLFSLAELSSNPTGARLQLPGTLIEPDLEQNTSGIAAFVYNTQGSLVWRSNSSQLLSPAPSFADFSPQWRPGQMHFQRSKIGNEHYFFAQFDTLWEDEHSATHPFRFALLHDTKSFQLALVAYRTQLWQGLGLVALVLLATQILLTGWALAPLARLAQSLGLMRSGVSQTLIGNYPHEIQQVIDRLNEVLMRETQLRSRYRNRVNDLAHSLKTPLAVLKATSDREDYQQHINEQVERMEKVVRYQLQKAVSEHAGSGTQIPLRHTLERLTESLKKIYRDKGLSINLDVPENIAFVGDEEDLMELAGNLLDNACKYGKGTVTVTARLNQQLLTMQVDDNGPGIAATARSSSLERGQRLDTAMPGQGIGLAVCADIACNYGGKLTIDHSPLGGARFELALPGAVIV
ncbi:ATP-binding protein [Gilvimarinus polysaccharolyticus]|uniref:ATP-binding protein n=1 Tax=Gilvimarinus polysaccharolyticus TaxID=863921 RepID=UPI0006732035|nr:ATP-binding protein [Gilvimarinus polysaccharolyticus]